MEGLRLRFDHASVESIFASIPTKDVDAAC